MRYGRRQSALEETSISKPSPADPRHRWFQAGEVTRARGGRADAPEGHGVAVGGIVRAATPCSDPAVFDAPNPKGGPLALGQLSHRVPAGLHGHWRNAAG